MALTKDGNVLGNIDIYVWNKYIPKTLKSPDAVREEVLERLAEDCMFIDIIYDAIYDKKGKFPTDDTVDKVIENIDYDKVTIVFDNIEEDEAETNICREDMGAYTAFLVPFIIPWSEIKKTPLEFDEDTN